MRKSDYAALYGLVFLLLMGNAGHAQVRAGVKAGFNVTNALWKTANPLAKPLLKAGLHGGVFAEMPLKNKWYLRPELLFSVKGWTNPSVDRALLNIRSSSVNLLYLSIPVLAGYRVSEKLTVVAGPEISLLLKARVIPADAVNHTDSYKRQDLGIALGAAFLISERMGVEARYVYGITALADFRNASGQPMKDGYNRLLQLSLHYIIHQGREP